MTNDDDGAQPLPAAIATFLIDTLGLDAADVQRASCAELTALTESTLGQDRFDLKRSKQLSHAVAQLSVAGEHLDGLHSVACMRLYGQLGLAAQVDGPTANELTAPGTLRLLDCLRARGR